MMFLKDLKRGLQNIKIELKTYQPSFLEFLKKEN
jgi:hypothetical protein